MQTFITHLKRYVALSVLSVAVAVAAVATPAFAQEADCKKNEQEVTIPIDSEGTRCIPINEKSDNLDSNPIFFYLRNIILFLTGGVGIAVVGGIIYGSYMYITARANAGQTQKGQEIIINSVVGLVLYIFMFAILQFLIPGGIFR